MLKRPGYGFLLLIVFGILCSLALLRLDSCRPNSHHRAENDPSHIPQRIICVSPGITEIVFALGCGAQIVGVSKFSMYPPEVLGKARIGGLIDPNRERILSLNPDLYLTQDRHTDMKDFCRRHGIRFINLSIESISDIRMAVMKIGEIMNRRREASELWARIDEGLSGIKKILTGRPLKKVFLSMGHTPGDLSGILTTGPGTFLDELIRICHGRNIFEDAAGLYPQISKEALVMRSPEIIIEVFTSPLNSEMVRTLSADWSQMSSLPAVRSGSIHILSDDYLLVPGVRVVMAAEKIGRLIHPEAFND